MNIVNEILIAKSARGHHVTFPYKPEPSAICGFHGIINEAGEQMHWDNTGTAVYWFIPNGNTKASPMRKSENCLALAIDMVNYWYGQKRQPGKPLYVARVVESGNAVSGRVAETEAIAEAA